MKTHILIKTITSAAFAWLLFTQPTPAQAAATVTTLVGTAGNLGTADGTGSAARFYIPEGVAADSSGNLYVADSNNHTIRKIAPGGVVSTLAGSPGVSGSADGIGNIARFNHPESLTVDTSGNVYVADTNNHTIRKVLPDGTVSTMAGSAGISGSTNDTGSAARFNVPRGVAVDVGGNVYVADTFNQNIRKVTPGGVVTTFVGSAGNFGTADGMGSAARFFYPQGVAVDGSGNVYVADTGSHTIRKATPGGLVSTLAGSPGLAGGADGTGSVARFGTPDGVIADGSGNVYVADTFNHTIRKVTLAGEVTTVAGSVGVISSADGAGSAARFAYPQSVAVDGSGNVYVADSFNHTIRKVAFIAETIAVVKKDDAAAGITNAKFVIFGNPAMNGDGHTAFNATVIGTDAAATTALMGKNKGIWADDSAGARQLIVRIGDTAPGTGSAVFIAFGDPVYNGNEAIAFKGTLKTGVGGVLSTPALTANNIGIWSNTGGTLQLVARRSEQAPGCPSGATFGAFTSFALPDQGGVAIIATLNIGGGGVTATNKTGIWAVDTDGDLQLIARTGATLDGKVITKLSFLPIAAGVSGQTRSFNANTGDLLYKATFADGSTGIYKVIFP